MPDPPAAKRSDAAAAAGIAILFFALYVTTLCRTVFWYDSAELTTAGVTLGITHPPGYPVYTWLAHAMTWLPVEPELAINAMSAISGALAVSLCFVMCRELGLARLPSSFSAAMLGVGGVFWRNAVVAEVYAPAMAATVLVTYLLLRGINSRRRSLTFAAAWLAGVALGLHLSIATLGIGFAWLTWVNGRCWKRALAAGGAALLGSLVFLYVPLRASQSPPLNICDPSSVEQLVWYLSGGAYKSWFGASPSAWDHVLRLGAELSEQLTPAGLALAAIGIAWLSRVRPGMGLGLVLMAAGNLGVFFFYQTHDVEVFILPTTIVLCCFAGAGVQAIAMAASKGVAERARTLAAAAVGMSLLAIPIRLGYSSHSSVDMSGFDETETYIRDVVRTLPEQAVIVTFTTPEEWKYYAVFGMFAQLVRRERNDVKHWVAPDLRKLARQLDTGPPVYAYARVSLLEHFFDVERAGPLVRVIRAKPGSETHAPRKRGTRTCGTFTELEVHDGS